MLERVHMQNSYFHFFIIFKPRCPLAEDFISANGTQEPLNQQLQDLVLALSVSLFLCACVCVSVRVCACVLCSRGLFVCILSDMGHRSCFLCEGGTSS